MRVYTHRSCAPYLTLAPSLANARIRTAHALRRGFAPPLAAPRQLLCRAPLTPRHSNSLYNIADTANAYLAHPPPHLSAASPSRLCWLFSLAPFNARTRLFSNGRSIWTSHILPALSRLGHRFLFSGGCTGRRLSAQRHMDFCCCAAHCASACTNISGFADAHFISWIYRWILRIRFCYISLS